MFTQRVHVRFKRSSVHACVSRSTESSGLATSFDTGHSNNNKQKDRSNESPPHGPLLTCTCRSRVFILAVHTGASSSLELISPIDPDDNTSVTIPAISLIRIIFIKRNKPACRMVALRLFVSVTCALHFRADC